MCARVHHVYSCVSRVTCPCVLSCMCAGSRVLPFSRALRFLGSDNQENFFTSTERHQIVSVWLWASDLPAPSREQRGAEPRTQEDCPVTGATPHLTAQRGPRSAPLGAPRTLSGLRGRRPEAPGPGEGGVVVWVLLAGEEGPRARAPAQPQHPRQMPSRRPVPVACGGEDARTGLPRESPADHQRAGGHVGCPGARGGAHP